jgi:hypothetical protein
MAGAAGRSKSAPDGPLPGGVNRIFYAVSQRFRRRAATFAPDQVFVRSPGGFWARFRTLGVFPARSEQKSRRETGVLARKKARVRPKGPTG